MNAVSTFADELQRAFVLKQSGVVGLVDEILRLAQHHHLRLCYQDADTSVLIECIDQPEIVKQTLPKSVFRAVIARLAVLCNEYIPDSVSLYHGEGELLLNPQEGLRIRVSFSNTPTVSEIELWKVSEMKLQNGHPQLTQLGVQNT